MEGGISWLAAVILFLKVWSLAALIGGDLDTSVPFGCRGELGADEF